MTTTHNYSIVRAKTLLGYRPKLSDNQMPNILKSRGLPVKGTATRRRWDSKIASSFVLAVLGLLALFLIPAWDVEGGLVGKSIC